VHDREVTIRGRVLGAAMQEAMRTAGLTGSQLAHRLGWSPSRVSRLLSGKRGGSELDVMAVAAICGIKGTDRERMLRLSREARETGWWQRFGIRLPTQVVTLIDHETEAVTITDFEPMFIPGLLQTDPYARAVISRGVNLPAREVEERVAARTARKTVISKPYPPQLTFIIHEFALRLPVGGPEVMSEQLHELLRLSARPNIEIRIIPLSAGAHAGMAGGFRYMTFTQVNPVVYLEGENSGLFLEELSESTAYRNVISGLAESALSEGQSREFIADLAMELYSNGEEPDART
jgi:transcriptional regulator with XRE-family HTH domain